MVMCFNFYPEVGGWLLSECYLTCLKLVSILLCFVITTSICGKVMFSYCVCLCVSVQAITFECLDIETLCLVWWYTLTISRSSLNSKVIGSRSRSFL